MTDKDLSYDIAIVGAGPAGLSLVARLAEAPLRIALIERQSESELASPPYDGREIALTRVSIARLKELGAWDHLSPGEAAPLGRAEVLNGSSPFVLSFGASDREGPIGKLVSNAVIRRILFETTCGQSNCHLITGESATFVGRDGERTRLQLSGGRTLSARLLVAADTRFSTLRKSLGIGAEMSDFGRTMLVVRVAHEKPHNGVATEWFDHHQTIAMLPLRGDQSSFVLTLRADDMARIAALSDADFLAEIERRAQGRWGQLTLASKPFCYPLVATYAHRFVKPGFALIGDAAVGMHPVTAHGYNFGLASAFALGKQLNGFADLSAGLLWSRLQAYDREHRRATLPLFTTTNAIAKLYSDERPAARFVRAAGLRAMQLAPGARALVQARLLQ